MADDITLDENVLKAARAGRKIEAIKLLREKENLGLKEAKEIIDRCTEPQEPANLRNNTDKESVFRRALPFIWLACALYLAYSYFGLGQ
ncbi:MAG: ribosomal protein L7/L12 [Pseudomonadales bacterium]